MTYINFSWIIDSPTVNAKMYPKCIVHCSIAEENKLWSMSQKGHSSGVGERVANQMIAVMLGLPRFRITNSTLSLPPSPTCGLGTVLFFGNNGKQCRKWWSMIEPSYPSTDILFYFSVKTPPESLLICKVTIHLGKQVMIHTLQGMNYGYQPNRTCRMDQIINLTPPMWHSYARIHDLSASQYVMSKQLSTHQSHAHRGGQRSCLRKQPRCLNTALIQLHVLITVPSPMKD